MLAEIETIAATLWAIDTARAAPRPVRQLKEPGLIESLGRRPPLAARTGARPAVAGCPVIVTSA